MSGRATGYVRWSKSIFAQLMVAKMATDPPTMAAMFSRSRTASQSLSTGAMRPFIAPNDTPKKSATVTSRSGGRAFTRMLRSRRGRRGTLRL